VLGSFKLVGKCQTVVLEVAVLNTLRLDRVVPGSEQLAPKQSSTKAGPDDLSREVFGILGLPVDVLQLGTVLDKIVLGGSPLLVSTPNVNFLITSRSNQEFRNSLLMSDLCLADGMPIVWLARLLGVPLQKRISGADLFEALKSRPGAPLKVFLFGGSEGVAQSVCDNLNSNAGGLKCVGALNPGFGTVDEISSPKIIDAINSSEADLLAVFFGATKAQSWLLLNRERLRIPIRAQFGATINFQAGIVKRAPKHLREAGLEWLWRIKEEPYLWRRYWDDGLKLFRLLVTNVLPLLVRAGWRHMRGQRVIDQLTAELKEDSQSITLKLSGALIAQSVDRAMPYLREVVTAGKQIRVDVSNAQLVDPRFFGLFLLLHKQMLSQGRSLQFVGVTRQIKWIFRLNGFDFLLQEQA
jgi:N-acetylglucosaminyldiphosphoundecaprenol N-acetyl-beta-D-mannosaminyltransferase